jgi:hypothetical protein
MSAGEGTSAPYLTGVASNSLYRVHNIIIFDRLPALQTLSFPNLTNVDFDLTLNELPSLTNLEFNVSRSPPFGTWINGTGLRSFIASIPIDVSDSQRNTIQITQNKNMSQIQIGLEVYDGIPISYLIISDNAPGAIIDLPNLKTINVNTSIGDFSRLNIPKLQIVNGAFNISNAQVARFSAPSLQSVVGDFNLTGNFSEYALESIISTITADINHYRVDLPALSAVKGNLYVRGATSFNCNSFTRVNISGSLDCSGIWAPLSTSTTAGPTSTATSNTSSTLSTASATSAGLSSAAKGGIGGGITSAVLFTIVLTLWYFWHKRRSSSTLPSKDSEHEKFHKGPVAAELPLGRHNERAELEASPNQVSELFGDHEYRPRSPIESLPVTVLSPMQTVVGQREQMRNTRPGTETVSKSYQK